MKKNYVNFQISKLCNAFYCLLTELPRALHTCFWSSEIILGYLCYPAKCVVNRKRSTPQSLWR